MKKVVFNNQEFDAPDWARYITMDMYGQVEAWEYGPRSSNGKYFPVCPEYRHQAVGHIRQLTRYQEIS